MDRLRVAFSSCPNDTFMFHALVCGVVACPWALDVQLDDIEALNERALGPANARPDVSKLSVAALVQGARDWRVLGAGAALGRGTGPLVVVGPHGPPDLARLSGRRVAIPGARTTAALLLDAFGPRDAERVPMRFDRIATAVACGDVAAGVLIHETRFTYAEHGLTAIADLGACWEDDTGLPLPLGVIAARRDHGPELATRFEVALRSSVEAAFADRSRSAAYVRQHAQEMSDDVCRRHIELYVNAFSLDLGDEGRHAIETMLRRAGVEASPW
jgi:1,4-dihydroxy-6-naphthoate synthase